MYLKLHDSFYLGDRGEYLENANNYQRIVQFNHRLDLDNTGQNIDSKTFVLPWQDIPETQEFNPTGLQRALGWLDIDGVRLVHCDYGQSRSPALAMTYLAKRVWLEPEFFRALERMVTIYPEMVYPSGLLRFVKEHWQDIQ